MARNRKCTSVDPNWKGKGMAYNRKRAAPNSDMPPDPASCFAAAARPRDQTVAWAHDDAYAAARGCLPAAVDLSSGSLQLACSGAVVRLAPVALERQVWELLKARRVGDA
eukprot:253092-Chlamydomonas_euryale.AAC.1